MSSKLYLYISQCISKKALEWETTLLRYAAIFSKVLYKGKLSSALRLKSIFEYLPYEMQCKMIRSFIASEQNEEDVKMFDDLLRMLKMMRNYKNKNREQVTCLAMAQKNFNMFKEALLMQNDINLLKVRLKEFQELFSYSKEEIKLVMKPTRQLNSSIEDVLMYADVVTDPIIFPFIGQYVEDDKKVFSINSDPAKIKGKLLFSEVLCTLPEIEHLKYDVLKFIEEDIKRKTTPLLQPLFLFSEFAASLSMDEDGVNKLKQYYCTNIAGILKSINEKVNDNIYIKKEIESNEYPYRYNICLAAMPVKSLIEHYTEHSSIETILPFLKEKIGENSSPESIKIFFYIQFVPLKK